MTADAARVSPTNTVLSGPAGGIIGGCHLADVLGRARPGDRRHRRHVARRVRDRGRRGGERLRGRARALPAARSRSTTSARSAPAAARSPGSTAACSRSARAAPAPIPARSATAAAASSRPSPTPPCASATSTRRASSSGAMRLADDAARGGRAGAPRRAARHLGRARRRPACSTCCSPAPSAPCARSPSSAATTRGEFSLIAFGGAGPLIAPLLAREMGIARGDRARRPVGVLGVGHARRRRGGRRVAHDDRAARRPRRRRVSRRVFAELDGRWRPSRCARQGVAAGDVVLERQLELRYLGQEHALPVAVGESIEVAALRKAFEELHLARYGHAMDNRLQVLNVRVRAIGRAERPVAPRAARRATATRHGRGPAPRRRSTSAPARWSSSPCTTAARLAPGDVLHRAGADRRGHVDHGRASAASSVAVEAHGYLLVTAGRRA